jgi:hypothetical protein
VNQRLYDSPNLLNTFERRNEGTTQKEVAANKKEYEEKMNVKPGDRDAKPPMPILGGVLAFESDWKPPLGHALQKALSDGDAASRLDIGCVAAHGIFCRSEDNFFVVAEKKPATAFGTYRSPARACDRSHD